MKDKIKIEFNENDNNIITRSLNDLRNIMIGEEISTDMINNVMLKINKRGKICFDKKELDIVLQALNTSRLDLIDKQENNTDNYKNLFNLMEKISNKIPIRETCER